MTTTSNTLELELQTLQDEAQDAIASITNLEDLEKLRISYLGKKGQLSRILRGMGQLSEKDRPSVGSLANIVKEA
ncbi:MAG: phenylalanine--tRNA ligase subunit alpha, partial [cyanobacterium endosymbiont of Rhopalodia fuxianensis]